MHLMSRKQDESIVIGDDVIVTVVEILGDTVCLAIDFSPDVPLERREAYEAMLREEGEELLVGG